MNTLYGYFVLPESLDKEHRRSFEWRRANPLGALSHFKKYPAVIGLVVALAFIYLAAHAVQSNWSFANIEKFNWTPKTIDKMFCDDFDFKGLIYWYSELRRIDKEMKQK